MATAALFIWPPSSAASSADAVVVLSGDHGERLPVALELIRLRVSETLVHAGDRDSPAANELCMDDQPFEVVCLMPEPDNTRNEARAVGELARTRGWRSVIVVTSTQHAARTGLVFRRCIDGEVHVVHARPAFGWRVMVDQIAQEWVKLAYSATVDRDC